MEEEVEIRVNGKGVSVPAGTTVKGLLERLCIGSQGRAVEVNGRIVTKGRHEDTILGGGDSVEIIQMVGGG